jgi:hypothetical protein
LVSSVICSIVEIEYRKKGWSGTTNMSAGIETLLTRQYDEKQRVR